MIFKRLFGRSDPTPPRNWSLPPGERVYVIGDIHGRLDLLNQMLRLIDSDHAKRGPARTTLISLGDLIDRGPESRGVIERWMDLASGGGNVICIAGNHEELLIKGWECERGIGSIFHRAGGRATMLSYGVQPEDYDEWSLSEMIEKIGHYVPEAHIAFLRSFKSWHRMGDYLFVHAGIRPGLPIDDQDVQDLRWIRREFTEDEGDHGCMVIHGHTITDAVDERSNRIGIDTGAFASGHLTAIGLEGSERWFLQT
jgi:serine/threonine protein phosphatase 1